MGKITKIQWCDRTWNPWKGCAEVSPGCLNCYARVLLQDRFKKVKWGKNELRKLNAKKTWMHPVSWNRMAKKLGLRYKVFPSMIDPFDESIPQEWKDNFWALIAHTEHLDWLILTKRPEFIESSGFFKDGPRTNVWLGVSVEDQIRAKERLPVLSQFYDSVPVVFVSYEPALEYVDFSSYLDKIDWLIVGGESGPKARPFHESWGIRNKAMCKAFETAFFFKQLGANPRNIAGDSMPQIKDKKGGNPDEWFDYYRVREFPVPRKMNVLNEVY